MPESRESRQDTALVQLLQALPPERLERVLIGLGLAPDKVQDAAHKPDPRRCKTCSHGYVRCRQMDEKVTDPLARHEWTPDRTRTGEPL